jgi:hypothetical protein
MRIVINNNRTQQQHQKKKNFLILMIINYAIVYSVVYERSEKFYFFPWTNGEIEDEKVFYINANLYFLFSLVKQTKSRYFKTHPRQSQTILLFIV